LAFGFGGAGGDNSNGKKVNLGLFGDLKTTSSNVVALVAQSLGGGGGSGSSAGDVEILLQKPFQAAHAPRSRCSRALRRACWRKASAMAAASCSMAPPNSREI
jgi:hypothetical protein